MTRTFQRPIKRIVVKLGSSQIADSKMRAKSGQLTAFAKQISQLRKQGIEVILVSSGAIALGMGELGESVRSTELAQLQARAAIGQAALMRLYSELFRKVRLKCAQVLLTWDDFDNRSRFVNAGRTLEAILAKGVVPVINENDTTSTEEIRFGDNDKLSALVATLIHADLLVILSDVEGFIGKDKQVLKDVPEITPEIVTMSGGTANVNLARGGMKTKIEAIKIATDVRIPCVITAGSLKDILVRLVIKRERIGTFFIAKNEKLLDGASEHEFVRSHFKNSKGS